MPALGLPKYPYCLKWLAGYRAFPKQSFVCSAKEPTLLWKQINEAFHHYPCDFSQVFFFSFFFLSESGWLYFTDLQNKWPQACESIKALSSENGVFT